MTTGSSTAARPSDSLSESRSSSRNPRRWSLSPDMKPGFVLLLLLATACVDRLPDQDLRILSATPDAKLSADLLWKAFQDNATEARRTYWGKVVEVTGTATVIGTDAPTERFVLFGQNEKFGVRANLLDDR